MRNRKTVAESLQALSRLDLTNIKRKLKEPAPEGKNWNDEQVDQAEKWYRRFLEVIVRFPDLNTVPNYVIDMFWHQHILDTRAYAQDCDSIFGTFIHHYPYFGLNGDAEQRDDCFDQTDDVYQELFGESCRGIPCFMDIAGCSQGCRDGGAVIESPKTTKAQGCNSGGSGTGCGQGCGRGGKTVKTPTTKNASGCSASCLTPGRYQLGSPKNALETV